MAEKLKPDLCVIGGGAGGLAVAAAAAAFGVTCVLIENHKLGGASLNAGAVPSKALLAAARRAASARSAGAFGVTADVAVDFAKVRDHVQGVIASVARNNSAERFTGLGVKVIHGHAAFKDRRTIVVGEQYEIRARRFVIATGSTPALPPVPGIDSGPYLTDAAIFALAERPRHLIVIGGSAIGIELAQGFRRLGSDVTVLEAAAPLADHDPECAATVLDQLAREGVAIRDGVNVKGVGYADGRVTVTIAGEGDGEAIEGTHLLVATGRKPTTEGLNLEAAGVRHDASGIAVSRKLKTSNRRIYAIGDVAAGQSRSTHAATYHAGLVIRSALLRQPVRVTGELVPSIIFTEPELAQTGLSEAEARKRRLKFRIVRWPYNDNDRAQAERATRGHIKVIVSKKGKILGAALVGAQASELITTWSLAIAQGLNIEALAGVVMPYPTFSEVGKRAAIDFFGPRLTRPLLRRIIAWLRIFG